MTFPNFDCLTLGQNNFQLSQDTRFCVCQIFNSPLNLPQLDTVKLLQIRTPKKLL